MTFKIKLRSLQSRLADSRYKMPIVVLFCVLIFVFLAVCGYYAVGKGGYFRRHDPSHRFETDMTYYYLPTITLSTGGGDGGGGQAAPRLRMEIGLGVASKDVEVVEGFKPKIMEKINSFVIKLKPDDIDRDDLMPWLRGQLLDQVNSAGVPFPIDSLYFAQLVVM